MKPFLTYGVAALSGLREYCGAEAGDRGVDAKSWRWSLARIAGIVVCVGVLGQGPFFAAVLRPQDNRPCRVHMLSARTGSMTVAACGSEIPIESSDHVWLEGEGTISPAVYEGRELPPGESQRMPALVPSVEVGLHFPKLEEGDSLVLLVRGEGSPDRFFTRAVTAAELEAGTVRAPAGTAVAFVRRGARNEMVVISKPERIPAGKSAVLSPVPREGAAVVGWVHAPDSALIEGLDMHVEGERKHAPDYVLTTGREAFALWQDVPERNAKLSARTKTIWLKPAPLTPRATHIEAVERTLEPLPQLTIRVTVPDEFRASDLFHDLRAVVENTAGTRREVSFAGAFTNIVTDLPPERFRVVLTAAGMKFQRFADLTQVSEGSVEFQLVPIHLQGVLSIGDRPVPGTLTFQRDGVRPVKADEQGRYEVTLWEPGLVSVVIGPDGEEDAIPYTELLRVKESQRLDFRLPSARARVEVVDALTGSAVGGAAVSLRNRWQDAAGKPVSAQQSGTTKPNGTAISGRLRPGTVEVVVNATGYDKGETNVDVAGETELPVRIRLQPVGATRDMHVVLPTGAPAVAAAAAVIDPMGSLLWTGVTDDSGVVPVPSGSEGGLLLVRHPQAGATVARVAFDAPIRLQPRATTPLTIQAIDSSERNGGSVPVVVWINDVRVSGAALGFLTGTAAATMGAGIWHPDGLPALPLKVLLSRGAEAAVRSGAYDALAVSIPYPWPANVNVRVVE
jgi:hypothetical protein